MGGQCGFFLDVRFLEQIGRMLASVASSGTASLAALAAAALASAKPSATEGLSSTKPAATERLSSTKRKWIGRGSKRSP